jgi:hypothetical protein
MDSRWQYAFGGTTLLALRNSILLVPLISFGLAGCGSSEASSAGSNPSDPVAKCALRGVAYFERIGSYPTLREPPNEGRPAEQVALERCRQNLSAF